MPSATNVEIEFWYDFASPYAYIASSRIQRLCEGLPITICWKPFLLGPIFKRLFGSADRPFSAEQSRYIRRDVERLSSLYCIELQWPTTYPRISLLASRIAVSAPSEQWRADFSRRVFHESFVANRDIESEIVLSEVLAKLAISPSEAIAISPRLTIAEAKTPNVKQLLIQQNNRAEALGIFGAPSFVARGELFWGNDRLERCIEWALGTHPINGNSH